MAGKKTEAGITVTAAATKLGKLGGQKGGPAQAKVLSAAQKRAIARKGGQAKAAKAGGKS